MKQENNQFRKWLYWFTLGLGLILIYKMLDNSTGIAENLGGFFNIITPFLVGTFIAYILYLPCKRIEKAFEKSKVKFISKKSRTLGILTTYLIAILIIILLINFILPVVVESVTDLFNNIQGYFEITIKNYNELPEDSFLKSEFINDAIKGIQNIDIKQYLKLDKVLEYAGSAISAVTSVFDVFVALIVSVYILSERNRIVEFLRKVAKVMFREKAFKTVDRYFNNSNEIFSKFIGAQFLDAVIVGILVTIAMSIMGIKYAPLLGFLIGLFNMIPYVGAIIAVGIAAVITLITGGLSQTLWMLVIVIILQQIDANIINPKIVGQSLKISPLLVIFSITVGGAYFGILGMFLAVPIAAIVKIIVNDYIEANQKIEKEEELLEENIIVKKIVKRK